jgi:hypothetical protein
MLIGIVGLIGSGKDTVADYLTNFHGFRRESFAGALKDAISAVFGWDRTLLEGRTASSRKWRETVDQWWSDRLGIPNLTPRYILQQWGTEVCRGSFHDAIWIASLENRLRSATDDIVISDCRFPNEIESIRNAGGLIIRTSRGADPEWFAIAERANTQPHSLIDIPQWEYDVKQLQSYNIHASETAWVGTKFDFVLNNNGSIDDLYASVRNQVLKDFSSNQCQEY